ncbi:MAG: hypothetical protein ACQESR_29430, partial [Planctomycetota bacterium]
MTGAVMAEKAPKAGLYQLVETRSLQFELPSFARFTVAGPKKPDAHQITFTVTVSLATPTRSYSTSISMLSL